MSPREANLANCTSWIMQRAINRLIVVSRKASFLATALLLQFPRVAAQDPVAANFTARPANPGDEQVQVQSDVISLTGLMDFSAWRHRGHEIRMSQNRAYCIGNLSLAVAQVGALSSYSGQGASGALSLLPTAGALIGAPTKELWVLYKLMPIAGFMSMILSLGGNIVPSTDSEYEVTSNAFSYGGLIATSDLHDRRTKDQFQESFLTSAEKFADAVAARAERRCVPNKRTRIACGIATQVVWFGVLMFACYITQAGGVVAWWCQAWGWMYFWYLMVAVSSLLENWAGVPFTKQWTIRVSKAPKVIISDSAPIITNVDVDVTVAREHTVFPGVTRHSMHPSTNDFGPQNFDLDLHYRHPVGSPRHMEADLAPQTASLSRVHTDPIEPLLPPRPFVSDYNDRNSSSNNSEPYGQAETRLIETPKSNTAPHQRRAGTHPYPISISSARESQANIDLTHTEKDILHELDMGFNSTSRVFMDPSEPYTVPRTPFYVIISLKGISVPHAALRVISKAISVAVFAAGTATFASTALLSITVALTTLSLVLGAGVFARVAALWMASEMIKMDPVLHRVVDTKAEAVEFIEAMLKKPGLVFEIMGHVIIEGRSVSRYNEIWQWPTLFGVLAPPFDVSKIAMSKKG